MKYNEAWVRFAAAAIADGYGTATAAAKADDMMQQYVSRLERGTWFGAPQTVGSGFRVVRDEGTPWWEVWTTPIRPSQTQYLGRFASEEEANKCGEEFFADAHETAAADRSAADRRTALDNGFAVSLWFDDHPVAIFDWPAGRCGPREPRGPTQLPVIKTQVDLAIEAWKQHGEVVSPFQSTLALDEVWAALYEVGTAHSAEKGDTEYVLGGEGLHGFRVYAKTKDGRRHCVSSQWGASVAEAKKASVSDAEPGKKSDQ